MLIFLFAVFAFNLLLELAGHHEAARPRDPLDLLYIDSLASLYILILFMFFRVVQDHIYLVLLTFPFL